MSDPAVHRHGVILVHGQGADRNPGDFLAEGVNAIADLLEAEGGTVTREFALKSQYSTAEVDATPPPGAIGVRHRYEFVEAFWDASFPPPDEKTVYRWARLRWKGQLYQTIRHWTGSLAQRVTVDTSNQKRGLRDDPETPIPIPGWVKRWYRLQVLAVELSLVAAFPVGAIVLPVLFALDVLDGTPGIRLFGFWTKISERIHSLDPFLTKVMGDSERYMDDGMWSASARGIVEVAILDMLARPDIDDVAIVAHSAGCGIAYDALSEGGRVGQAGAAGKAIALVTLGSAINRYYWFSEEARNKHDASMFEQRFAVKPLARSVTRTTGTQRTPLADADAEDPRRKFSWLNVYARFDPVPAGPVYNDLIQRCGIDGDQLVDRQVINLDSPLGDHGAYFANQGLVVSRVVRQISGGEPWQAVSPGEGSWTRRRVQQHLNHLAKLRGLHASLAVTALLHVGALLLWAGYRHGVERIVEGIASKVWNGLDEATRHAVPLVGRGWDPDARSFLVQMLAVMAPVLVLIAVERLIHQTKFSDL